MGKIYKNGILFAGSTDSAKSVAFDNTNTDLEADNVQEAIEEIKDDVAVINNNLLKIKSKTYHVETGAEVNYVSQLYFGEKNIKSDFPVGKILAIIPVACGYDGWSTGAGITASYDNYILQYGCHWSEAKICIKVYWIYI